MNRKFFYGAILALFVGINLFQANQINLGNLSIQQLTAINSANAEDEDVYIIDVDVEYGYCDACCDGTKCTCKCTRIQWNCLSNGWEYCVPNYTIYIDPDDCVKDGGAC